MIRSSFPIVDEAFCAFQGYAGALFVNAVKGVTVVNPSTAAFCLASIALTEKIFYEISQRIVPGFTGFLGPIPIGTKNVVSYGLATYTTFKIMVLAGLTLTVPKAVGLAGVVCLTALGVSGIYAIVKHYSKTFEELLREHVASTAFANKIFTFKNENKQYDIRIICNPTLSEVNFHPGGIGTISNKSKYIVSCDSSIPQPITNQLKELLGEQVSWLTGPINSTNALSYTAQPEINTSSS